MSDFLHLADKFKNKLGISSSSQQNQQGGYYQNPPPQPSPGGYPYHDSGASHSYQQPPQYYTQPGPPQPWGPSYQPAGFPSPDQYLPPRPGGSSLPPPIPPRVAPPAIPERPVSNPTRDSESPNAYGQQSAPVGAIYAPGTYPTPELFNFPLGKYTVLSSPAYGYTAKSIQHELDQLGPSSTLYLPRGSRWEVEEMITMHPFQELATEGYPTAEHDMAWLEAKKELNMHMVTGFQKSGVRLRNLLFEGGREKYGHNPDGRCMIIIGASDTCNQVVDRCIIRNPRHWSCLQAFEGSTNIRITNNFIGPAGQGADVVDGKWADGISFSASDGLVAGNQIVDATDGAIVIFGAPGSLITSNTVINRHRLCLGGLNMVDYNPHKGNYNFTRVINNTVRTEGAYIKVGVGMGPSILGKSDPEFVETGAVVLRNLVESKDVGYGKGGYGYGYAIGSDTANWTCLENVSAPGVEYSGDISASLPELIAPPMAFVREGPAEARGNIQKEFVRGHIECLFRIKPGPSTVLGWSPGQLRLNMGSHLSLRSIRLCLDRGGEVCVRSDHHNGRILWTGGSGWLHRDRDAALVFAAGGKLLIVDTSSNATLHDFTPHIPYAAYSEEDAHMLMLCEVPHQPCLAITSPAPRANTLFMSSYHERCGREFAVGQFVARYCGQGRGTLVTVLNPYTQLVVLRSKHDGPIRVPLVWPLDESEWETVWTSPNERSNEDVMDAKLAWQGDGNLVIYANGGVPWATATMGREPPATTLRWGLGTPEEPYMEIVDDNGARHWST
ncbi:right-handed beta helix region protein [Ceratobasidium sp. AG-Ba]|nr:right-handed beta helix region protein [Ceratobasidium sp. AG-Ba]